MVASLRVSVKSPVPLSKVPLVILVKFVSSNNALKSTVKVDASSRENVAIPVPPSTLPLVIRARFVSSIAQLKSTSFAVPVSSVYTSFVLTLSAVRVVVVSLVRYPESFVNALTAVGAPDKLE